MSVEERLVPAMTFKPEVASLNMGSMNFGLYPMLGRFKDFKHDWERQHLENSRNIVFKNTYADIEYILTTCAEQDTRFEVECYDIGHLYTLAHFIDRGLIKPIRHGVSRFYDAAARARFETILRGKQLGFTLTQIFAMLPKDEKPEAAETLELEEGQVLSQIAQLERKREELDTALAALRETHGRMTGGDARSASAA